MKTLKFKGQSDDLFIELTTKTELCNNADDTPMFIDIKMPDGSGLRVGAFYGDAACWMLGASSLEEDKPVQWPIRLNPCSGGYCGMMEIDAPEEAEVTEVQR